MLVLTPQQRQQRSTIQRCRILILVRVAFIDLINDGTGYTLPPLTVTSAPSQGINATAGNYDKSRWSWSVNRSY